MTNPSESHLLEELSDLEHEQWMRWSKTIHDRMKDAIREGKNLEQFTNEMYERWYPNWKSYEKLDWETKEYDREWSRQVLGIIRKYMK